jgi:hypothetical protein
MKSKNDSDASGLDVNIEGIDVVLIYCKKNAAKELVEVKTGYACMKIKITFLTQAE